MLPAFRLAARRAPDVALMPSADGIWTEHGLFGNHSLLGCSYADIDLWPANRTVMPLNPESKYPSRRAYVLKMRSDATPDAFVGRLENLVTGQQREFASGHELLDSIASDLEADAREWSVDATRK